MQIAVTGGLGRLGRYVVRALAQHNVRVLDIGTDADHHADLRDLDALRTGLRDIEVVQRAGSIAIFTASNSAFEPRDPGKICVRLIRIRLRPSQFAFP